MSAEPAALRPAPFPQALFGGIVGALLVLGIQLVWGHVASAATRPADGVVQADGRAMGRVHYAAPFEFPPALTFDGQARYVILEQDGFGFTWADKTRLGDVPSAWVRLGGLGGSQAWDALAARVPEGTPARFTWRAEGLLARDPVQRQEGVFASTIGESGQVGFGRTFASPPEVALIGGRGRTIVTEVTPTSFHWKNTGDTNTFDTGDLTWRATGTVMAE